MGITALFWLKAIALALVLLVNTIEFGNFESAGLGLPLFTLTRCALGSGARSSRRFRSGSWCLSASGVTLTVGGPPTPTTRKLMVGLYDLNCNAPFPCYRYPRDVMWLAEGV